MSRVVHQRELRSIDDAPDVLAEPVPQRIVRTRLGGIQGPAVVAIATVLVVGGLKAAEGFFVPLVLGLVIALALAPLVRRLQRFMPRWIASALVVTTFVAALGTVAYSLSDEAAQAVSQLPEATRVLRQTFRALTGRSGSTISQLQQAAKELQKTATESSERPSMPAGVTAVQVVAPPVDFSNVVWFGSQGVLSIAGLLAVLVFLVYFLLATGDLFKRKLVRLSGERLSRRKVTVQVIDQIGERVARSMLHLVFTSILVGLCTWGLLAAFDVRYAGLWGLAAGLLNCVPYLGPAVVAGGLLVAGLMQFGDITTAVTIASISLAVTTIEGSLLTPILFGREASLNSLAVFVSFMFWGWLWGASGMLLALPLLTIVKTVAESIDDLEPFAELLSD
jgi:predicted PurR-regulated permease PerM